MKKLGKSFSGNIVLSLLFIVLFLSITFCGCNHDDEENNNDQSSCAIPRELEECWDDCSSELTECENQCGPGPDIDEPYCIQLENGDLAPHPDYEEYAEICLCITECNHDSNQCKDECDEKYGSDESWEELDERC